MGWCLRQDTDTLLDVLATFTALTLEAVSGSTAASNIAHADQLAAALNLDMAGHWQPSPRFMGRVSKAVMAAAVTEAEHPAVAADLMVMKKAGATSKAAETLAGTGWLPPVLRRPEAAAVNGNVLVARWRGTTRHATRRPRRRFSCSSQPGPTTGLSGASACRRARGGRARRFVAPAGAGNEKGPACRLVLTSRSRRFTLLGSGHFGGIMVAPVLGRYHRTGKLSGVR